MPKYPVVTGNSVLLTGASGYLGRLVAAALLAKTDFDLVLPIRAHHAPQDIREQLITELQHNEPLP